MVKPLSDNLKDILRMTLDRGGFTSGGRYGWNVNHLRALERRGLLALVSKHTHDSNWKLTEEGKRIATECEAEWRAAHNLPAKVR